MPLHDWLHTYTVSGCFIAWQKLYCRDEKGLVRSHGLQQLQNENALRRLEHVDPSYPSILEMLIRRLHPRMKSFGRMNCCDTIACIMKNAGLLQKDADTQHWTPDSFRTVHLEASLSPGVTYFREQQLLYDPDHGH